MNVSERIKAIVSYIKYKTIADIGTDHGYISIYAKENKNLTKIIACDVNKEPLENCKKNINLYNLQDEIETRLGSGIEKLEIKEVETIIIAGMGGNLILDILKNDLNITMNTKQLILQPQSSCYKVRKFIHEIGFSIADEKIVYEDKQFYFVLDCLNKKEESYTEEEYLFGKILINNKNQLLKKYLQKELKKEELIKNNIISKSKINIESNLKVINDNIIKINYVVKKL